MMTDGSKRMKIVLSMRNPWDYVEFCEACRGAGIEPLPVLEFAQKVGMVMVAVHLYPADEPADAYMKLLAGEKTVTLPAIEDKDLPKPYPSTPVKRCCGGGTVR
jgi:hypothetical protein